MSLKKTIIVIDDEEEFREAAKNIARPLLPEDWEIKAPDTLDEAMHMIHDRVVKLVFIDRNLSSEGYQELDTTGREYKTATGIEVAIWLQRVFPHIRRIAYSKGGLGCGQFNGHVDAKFPLKQQLNRQDAEGEFAREEFRKLLLEELASIREL